MRAYRVVTHTTGSMLSDRINEGLPWRSMFLIGAIWRFRTRCRIFSACFRTRQPVRPTLSAPDGAMASSERVGNAKRTANYNSQ